MWPTQDGGPADVAPNAARVDSIAPISDVGFEPPDAMAGPSDIAVPPDTAIEGCFNRFVLTEWVIEEAPFEPWMINDLLASDIESGDLLLLLQLQIGPVLEWIDAQMGARGEPEPDPEIPPTAPLSVMFETEWIFQTRPPGEAFVGLGAANYGGAQALVWHLYGVTLRAAFSEDCRRLSGRFTGAFRNEPGFSIPGRVDVDTDLDGVADAFGMHGTFVAERE